MRIKKRVAAVRKLRRASRSRQQSSSQRRSGSLLIALQLDAVGTFLGRLSCTRLNSTGTRPSGPLDLVEPAPQQHPRSHRMRPARPIEVRNTRHETRDGSHARRQRSSAIEN